MPHYKSMFDGEKDSGLLFACHLDFKDTTLTIKSVSKGKVTGAGGKSSGKPLITFADHDRKLALNKTNGATLAMLFGSPDTDRWIGQRITLYPTSTTFGAEQVECIRVRPIKLEAAPVAAFDLDGWKATIAGCATFDELSLVRDDIKAAKPPKSAHAPLAAAIEAARERIAAAKGEAAP